MEVFLVDPVTFMSTKPILGYSSMIWTEKFGAYGEFEMKHPDPLLIEWLAPKMCIGIRESRYIMIIDTINVSADAYGDNETTIKGRTIESTSWGRYYLDPLVSSYSSGGDIITRVALPFVKPSERLGYMLWQGYVCDDPLIFDGRHKWDNIIVTDAATKAQSDEDWDPDQMVKLSDLLDTMMRSEDLGIRSLRPYSGPGTKLTFPGGLPGQGNVVRTAVSNPPQLRLEVYDGKDRQVTQTVNSQVILSQMNRTILNEELLFSRRDLVTSIRYLYAVSGGGADAQWYTRPGYSAPSGRSLYYEFQDWTDVKPGDADRRNTILYRRARRRLAATKEVTDISADVDGMSKYKYGTDYNLGDYISVKTFWGALVKAQVTGYTRSMDRTNGPKEYPEIQFMDFVI